MESLKLVQFYRSLSSWPKNEADLAVGAERIRKALDVPLALFWVHDLGLRVAGVSVSLNPSLDAIRGFLEKRLPRSQAMQMSSFQEVELDGAEHPFAPLGLGIKLLAAAPIGERGWLVVGLSEKMDHDAEIALLASAQHLFDLAALAESETAISLRDQFLSIASHELKTPLTSIYGILQLQERMLRPKKEVQLTKEQEKQHNFFKMVIRQVERLNELIDGLLDVSRIQNGRFVVEPSDTDVAALTRETVQARLTVIASEQGVRIQLDTPESLMAWVDPVRFEEVVTNLTMNAIRFSPEGGMVWVKLREEGGQVILGFRDQGPSVPEADQSRIFQPFERAQRTARLGGLGLGLFISRQIAQLHGGNVELTESIAGKGNLIEARFPVRGLQQISA